MKVPTRFDSAGGNLEEPGKYNFQIQQGYDNEGEYGRSLSLLLKVMDGEYEGYTRFEKFKLDVHEESKDGIARGVKKLFTLLDVINGMKEYKDMDEITGEWKKLQDKLASKASVAALFDKLAGAAFEGDLAKKKFSGKEYFEIVEFLPIHKAVQEGQKAAAGDSW